MTKLQVDFKRTEKPTSKSRENRPQKDGKTDTNHTDVIHTDVIHTDVNQTVVTHNSNSSSVKEKTDRKTDRPINKSMEEIINEIGYQGIYFSTEIFTDEDELLTDTMVNHLKCCNIPEEYHQDTKSLEAALRIFVQWNYAYNGFKKQSDKELYSHIVQNIFSFLSDDITYFKDRNVTYSVAFEKINRKIHAHGELYSWIVMAMDEWKTVISKTKIKNPAAYLKMCIWNWLSSDELEFKSNVTEYEAYNSTSGTSKESSVLSPDYLDMLMKSSLN